jgi:hypothetical protein
MRKLRFKRHAAARQTDSSAGLFGAPNSRAERGCQAASAAFIFCAAIEPGSAARSAAAEAALDHRR